MSTPHSIASLRRAADQALTDGRVDDAIAGYVAALTDDAAQPDVWFNLAWAQRAARRFDEALASYGQALSHGVSAREHVHLNRAAILSDHLFRRDDAITELLAATACDPYFVAAWLNLGQLHEDDGDADAARTAYRRVIAIDPANARARSRLAVLEVMTGSAQAAAADIEAALASPTASRSPHDRSELLFGLGQAYDALARYDEALSAIEDANRLARRTTAKRYDRAAQEELVDRLIASFPVSSSPRKIVPTDKGTSAPVFICGMFRSGSTLVEQLLARHPAICPAGELEFMPALARTLTPYPEAVSTLDAARLSALRRDYLAGLPSAELVTDKRCDNFLHIGLIFTLFPEARIIHTLRNPLDNLLSVYFLPFGDGVTYDTDLADALHFYLQYRRLMAHWTAVFPGAIHDVDYDRLVVDPNDEIGAAFDYLGVGRTDVSGSAQSVTRTVKTASGWQVRQPLHALSSGRWRHYRDALAGVAAALEAAGYLVTRP